jgi:hypothetical protein
MNQSMVQNALARHQQTGTGTHKRLRTLLGEHRTGKNVLSVAFIVLIILGGTSIVTGLRDTMLARAAIAFMLFIFVPGAHAATPQLPCAGAFTYSPQTLPLPSRLGGRKTWSSGALPPAPAGRLVHGQSWSSRYPAVSATSVRLTSYWRGSAQSLPCHAFCTGRRLTRSGCR